MKTYAKYGAGLIAVYLIVKNGTNSGRAMDAGASGLSKLVRAFQGR